MSKTAWDKKVDDLKKKFMNDYPHKKWDVNREGTDPYWILSHQGDYNLTQIGVKDWGNIPSLIDKGYMLVGSIPGHVVLIVGYRKDNNAIYYCMDTDMPKNGSYGKYVEIKQVQFEEIFKFNIK